MFAYFNQLEKKTHAGRQQKTAQSASPIGDEKWLKLADEP
jgi:hypothetical protein